MRFQSILGIAFTASAAALLGCGDDSAGGGDGGSGATSSSSSGSQGGGGAGGAGDGGGGGDAAACTAAGELCASFLLPDGFQGTPTKLIVTLYETLPAAGPPDKILKLEANPQITVGTPYAIKATGVTEVGSYRMLAVLYMPGGGSTVPTPDVDYDVASEALMLTGGYMTVGPFEFALHTATDGHVEQ
jgi:hypothetical protein